MAAPKESSLHETIRNKRLEPLSRLISEANQWRQWAIDSSDLSLKNETASLHQSTGKELALKEQNMRSALEKAEFQYQANTRAARVAYENKRENLERTLREQQHGFSYPELPWDAPDWQNFDAKNVTGIPLYTRCGDFHISGQEGKWVVPALLPIIGSNNVFIKASGAAKDEAHLALQSLILRLVASLPPGKLRLTMLDPIGLGANMAGFMKLPDALTGGRIWTESNQIERQLVNLSEHMEKVIQKYLLNRYDSMQQFNQESQRVQEPYRLLAVANFPANFSDSAARRLLSIASNGPRTGVYVLGVIDSTLKLPYDFDLRELERHATIIDTRYTDSQQIVFSLRVPGLEDCDLQLDVPPPQSKDDVVIEDATKPREKGATIWTNSVFDRICNSVAEESVAAGVVRVPFSDIEPSFDWENTSNSESLQIPLGCYGAHDVQQLTFGVGTEHSALVIGKTGSGKSSLLHVIVLAAAMKYSPDELEMYLLDLKQVEFVDYAEHNLPHARVVAMQSEREFGLSVLEGLAAELKKRQDKFQGIATNIKEYRAARPDPKDAMPRILLLVDEFQELFIEDDKVSIEAASILDRLVRLGRAFGIHVILATQTLSGKNVLSNSTKEQMAVRIALQCSESDSRQILADDNPAARLLERPGEAIYNSRNGLVEGNNSFQAVYLSKEERIALMKRIDDKVASSERWKRREPMVVFRGKEPAKLESSVPFQQMINSALTPKRSLSVGLLGEAVAIKPPTACPFRRQSRANLLIVGQQEESAATMLISSLLSLSAQHGKDEARFFVGDWSDIDAPYHGLLSQVASDLPQLSKVLKTRDLPATLQEIADIVTERTSNERNSDEAIYLFLLGLQRPRDLRRDESGGSYGGYSFSETRSKSTAELFAQIVREGPEVGVHTLAWADTMAGLDRVVGRREINEWEYRIAFSLGLNDSNILLDSAAATKLQPPFALFYDEERAGYLEKFSPYGLPSKEWIHNTTATLRRKART